MRKRALTLTLLFCLLTPFAVAPAGGASSPADSPSARQKAAAAAERTGVEAGKNVTLDQAGRVTRATLPVADGKEVSFAFECDRQNRLQYITPGGGARMRLDYDVAGQWQGFSFPDGARLVLTRDRSGNINGLKEMSKSAGRTYCASRRRRPRSRRTTLTRPCVTPKAWPTCDSVRSSTAGSHAHCSIRVMSGGPRKHSTTLNCSSPKPTTA